MTFSIAGIGKAFVGLSRPRDGLHAGLGQQRPRLWPLSGVWQDVPVETAEPRQQGSHENAEAGALIIQVHGLHGHLWTIQALRNPCLHRSQVRNSSQFGLNFSFIIRLLLQWRPKKRSIEANGEAAAIQTFQNVRRDHDNPHGQKYSDQGKKDFRTFELKDFLLKQSIHCSFSLLNRLKLPKNLHLPKIQTSSNWMTRKRRRSMTSRPKL